MKITIFGSGYVGLVAGACLAEAGHNILLADPDHKKIDMLNSGKSPIYEPGLDTLLERNLSENRLIFTTDLVKAVNDSDLLFIAVGTPSLPDGNVDLSQVTAVAQVIGHEMMSSKIIVNKSTVPVGTAEFVQSLISNELITRKLNLQVEVCSNPEFLKEGTAIEDFAKGARIIIGTHSERVKQVLQECYSPYNRNHEKIIFMDTRAAELTKYAANAMLATKISFMNELANLADRLSVDIEQVRQGIGSDPRIGFDFIYPGCGYGGSCFPKDVAALIEIGTKEQVTLNVLKSVQVANDFQKNILFSKIEKVFPGKVGELTVAIWGLAFKPGTDDIREAPSLNLIRSLLKEGSKIQVFDPVVSQSIENLFEGEVMIAATKEDALQGADILVICTEWKSFRVFDYEKLVSTLKQKAVFDGRNIWNPEKLKKAGIKYFAIGRGERVLS
jgi:UDPglucose 6-dehydrogenase